MNELTVFQNEQFGEVRLVEKNGEPWFVGKDVAEALGYSNSRDALLKHVDSRDKDDVAICDAIGREQSTVVINESGLYSLIIIAPDSGLSRAFTALNFEFSKYTDPTGRKLSCYHLTRDGFTIPAIRSPGGILRKD